MGKRGFIAMRIVEEGPEGYVKNITKSPIPDILMVGALLIVVLIFIGIYEGIFLDLLISIRKLFSKKNESDTYDPYDPY